VFECLPHKWVTPAELREIVRTGTGDRRVVYGVQVKSDAMVERKSDGGFNREEYYKHPELYRPVFAERVRYCPQIHCFLLKR